MALIKAINPSKRTLSKGIKYICNPLKTNENLISGKDCDAQTALEEMQVTKELYRKKGGRQYKHFIQSFNPDDPLNSAQAHQIGYEMAQKAFPGYEVLVATHTDTDHLHNHIIVNSVSFETGEKYQLSNHDLQEIKELSNQICEREGLHVIKKEEQTPGKALSMNEYQVAMKGESWKFRTMADIDQALDSTGSKEKFIKAMEEKGYKVVWNHRKYITYTTPDGKKVRDNKLHDPKYLKEAMERGYREIEEIKLQSSDGAERNAPNVDWGAIERNIRDEANGLPVLSGDEIVGTIQQKVRAVKERTDRAVESTEERNSRLEADSRKIAEQQPTIERKHKPRGRKNNHER